MSNNMNDSALNKGTGEAAEKWYRSRKFWMGLLIFFLGYAALYILFAQQYRTKYFQGTYINGEDVSLKTVDEVPPVCYNSFR